MIATYGALENVIVIKILQLLFRVTGLFVAFKMQINNIQPFLISITFVNCV